MSKRMPPSSSLWPQVKQLDLDGRLHDLPLHSERLRLFEPAPAQISGQTRLELEPTGRGER